MPMGKYEDWNSCKSDGKSDEYCGWLKRHAEILPEDITHNPGDVPFTIPLDVISDDGPDIPKEHLDFSGMIPDIGTVPMIPAALFDTWTRKREIPEAQYTPEQIKETIQAIREEFNWLSEDYVKRLQEVKNKFGGEIILIRAAVEAITDHRPEGAQYKRKYVGDELHSLARTGIFKDVDINHNSAFRTLTTVLDGEYDKERKEVQFVTHVTDKDVIESIKDGKITAVSINAGMPRDIVHEPCDDHTNDTCAVPRGLILGEKDGIAFTWVVTHPEGMTWNGHHITAARPGINKTAIQIL